MPAEVDLPSPVCYTEEVSKESMRRTVVKSNWWDATVDEGWENLFGLLSGFVVLGVLVTSAGALYGYVSAPKDENAAPYVMDGAVNINVGFWKGVGFMVATTAQMVQGLRPDTAEEIRIPVEPFTPPINTEENRGYPPIPVLPPAYKLN